MIKIKWKPDDCVNGSCLIEAPGVGFPPATFLRKCQRHADMPINDSLLHSVIVFSSRRRERARWEAKLGLGISKEETVDYRVNPDGSITLLTGATGALRASIVSRINNALAGLESTPGVSTITVE